jgi:hypothetical protein
MRVLAASGESFPVLPGLHGIAILVIFHEVGNETVQVHRVSGRRIPPLFHLSPLRFVLYFFIWSAKIFFNPPKPAVDRQGLRIINAIEMPKTIFENYPYNSWQNWLFSHSERREGSQLSEKLRYFA